MSKPEKMPLDPPTIVPSSVRMMRLTEESPLGAMSARNSFVFEPTLIPVSTTVSGTVAALAGDDAAAMPISPKPAIISFRFIEPNIDQPPAS